jgi:quercetin dioxygenase-like cupin family protein
MYLFKSQLVSGIAVLVAACGAHRQAAAASGEPAPMPVAAGSTAGPDAILLTLADLEWIENAERPGTYQAAAEGEPATGPAHFYLKYAKGFTGGLHSHTSDHGGWILAGTVILVIDGKETKLPPGAFYFVKGGKPHIAGCDPSAECIMTVDIRDKWDVVAEPRQ